MNTFIHIILNPKLCWHKITYNLYFIKVIIEYLINIGSHMNNQYTICAKCVLVFTYELFCNTNHSFFFRAKDI